MISSTQNPKIKELTAFINKPNLLRRSNLIIVEGQKECSLAVVVKVNFKTIFFCSEIISLSEVEKIFAENLKTIEIIDVSKTIFSKIAYRETTGGIVALAERPEKKLENLKVFQESVFIILDAVEKPGNLGAICRVADAAAVSGIIITNLHTDIYNTNAIRSSLGCVFTVDVVCAEFEETIKWLKNNEIKSYCAELKNSNYYYETDFSGKIALIFGTEATGLPKKWIENSDFKIKIPMEGVIDSLNVNTSAAIIVFEAMKQKKINKTKNNLFKIICFLCLIFFISCVNSENYKKLKKEFQSIEYSPNNYDTDSLFKKIPEYQQICNDINKYCKTFDENSLLKVENVSLYENSKETAIALGMYMADLGLVRHFEKIQLCMDYLDAVKTLSEKLTIGEKEFNKMVSKIEQNIDNQEYMYLIIDSLMNIGKKFLSEKETVGLNTLFLCGFWIETGYIALYNCKSDEYKEDIKNSHLLMLVNIIKLLDAIEDNDIFLNLKKDLKKIENNNILSLEEIKIIRGQYIF